MRHIIGDGSGRVIAFWAAALLLLTPSRAQADDWPSFGLDGPRGRRSAERTGVAFATDWRATLPGGPRVDRDLIASPAVANGVLALGALDRHVRALDAATGTELWRRDLEHRTG